MKTMPLSEVKAQLSKLVAAVDSRDERVTITRNGRPAAVLVSADEFESWQATHEITSDPESMASIRRALKDVEAGRVIEEDELRSLFGVAGDRKGKRGGPQARPSGAKRRSPR